MIDVFQQASKKKRQAESILADLDLVRKWERFGRPALVGAFAYDILVTPDIDMEIYCPDLRIEHVGGWTVGSRLRGFKCSVSVPLIKG